MPILNLREVFVLNQMMRYFERISLITPFNNNDKSMVLEVTDKFSIILG
jgi:hypothetical protein